MKPSIKSFLRLIIAALTLMGLQSVLAHALSRARLLEHLLAPGIGSEFALLVTVLFLFLRGVVFVILPGWIVARTFLIVTGRASTREPNIQRP